MEKIFNGEYFKQNPNKILGTSYTHNPRTGRQLTNAFGQPVTEVWGKLEDALAQIKVPEVKRYEHRDSKVLQATESSGNKTVITEIIAKTEQEIARRKAHKGEYGNELLSLEESIKIYNKNVEYKDESGVTKHYNISNEEIIIWITYQVDRGLYDKSVIRNNAWGKYYKEKVTKKDWLKWFEGELAAFDGKEWMPASVFYSGNIYARLTELKTNKQAIINEIGETGFDNQLDKMEKVRPVPLTIKAEPESKLWLYPFDKIWEEISITELADGSEVKYGIRGAFYDWMQSLPANDFIVEKKSSRAYEINSYWVNKEHFPRGRYTESEKSIIKRNAQMVGGVLFDRFLTEALTREDKAKIAALWNSKHNNYVDIPHYKIPVGFEINKRFKGGELRIRPAQREGVAFFSYRGTGILGYDVGVGKTMTDILSIADAWGKGLYARPLVNVPQKVIKKWIAETVGIRADKDIFRAVNGKKKKIHKKGDLISEGIIPYAIINDYDNLGVKVIGRTKDESGQVKRVAPYSITFVTFEGMVKIGFREESESELLGNLKKMLSQGESGRGNAKVDESAEGWIDNALSKTEIDIEDLGIDAVHTDEAHNFRNLFMEVKGDIDGDGERQRKDFQSGGGKPSTRAIKLFMLHSYIHARHNNRNTFGLTATPFTNRATEVYSMLAMYDYQGLKDFDVYNINQFCVEFIDERLESAFTAKGRFEIKATIRGYNNLPVLQAMVYRAINYKTGEDANIHRPDKIILPLLKDDKGLTLENRFSIDTKLPPHPEQLKWLKEAQFFAATGEGKLRHESYSPVNPNFPDGPVKGQILIALNASRIVTFSHYALSIGGEPLFDVADIDYKRFVNDSPKLKYICECIKTVKAYHETNKTPVSGQLIYSDRGTDWFGHIKEYLVKEVGYLPDEVAVFTGKTSKGKREKIKNDFQENKIKIIIGTSTMREGVDLQKHCSCIYSAYLDWNPTDLHQLWGRGWRFGNKFSHVRIVMPLVTNSSDIHTWQKLSEKMSRLNSIWTRSTRSKMFEEAELDAEELKRGLISDPKSIVQFDIDRESEDILSELSILKAQKEQLLQAIKIRDSFDEKTDKLIRLAEEAKTAPKTDWGTDEKKIIALKAMEFDIGNIKSVYRIVRAYAKLKDYYDKISVRNKVERHIKDSKAMARVEREVLRPLQLGIMDNFDPVIEDWQNKINDLSERALTVKSKAYFGKKLEKVIQEKEEEEQSKKPLEVRVKDFARLNYLLDCFDTIHNCDIYNRIELKSGQTVKIKPAQQIKIEQPKVFKMSSALSKFMPPVQASVVRSILKQGENPEGYYNDVIKPLEDKLAKLPKLYGTEGQGDEKMVWIRIFMGTTDWYISEYDGKDKVFGFVVLNGDVQNAESGYSSMKEIRKLKKSISTPEIDFHWKPKTLREVKEAVYGLEPVSKSKTVQSDLQVTESLIEGLKVSLDFLEGKDAEQTESLIKGLEVSLEFLN